MSMNWKEIAKDGLPPSHDGVESPRCLVMADGEVYGFTVTYLPADGTYRRGWYTDEWGRVEGNVTHWILLKDVPLPDKSEWIPVSERLPDKGVEVLVLWDGERSIGILDNDGQWKNGDELEDVIADVYITHWQPLPEPPK